jgi:hypothetical protein
VTNPTGAAQTGGRPGRGGAGTGGGGTGAADGTATGTGGEAGRGSGTTGHAPLQRRLTFTDVHGRKGELTVQRRPDAPTGRTNGAGPLGRRDPTPAGQLRALEVVEVGTSNAYVYKRLPKSATGADAHSAHAAFDNEVQIGLHLANTITGAAGVYPRELSRLVGYNDTAEEPFLILAELGQPVHGYARRIAQGERFQASLMRALSILEAARVVHRNLTPETVHWTESHVQIADFRHARLTGEPCRPARSPLCAPEARQHDAVADPAEDLWSAGLVIVHVLNGPLRPGDPVPPDLRDVRAAGLDRTLDGVFRPQPRDRPPLDIIMADLNALHEYVPPDTYGDGNMGDRRFRAGQEEFEQVSRNKASGGPATGPTDAGTGGGRGESFGDDW